MSSTLTTILKDAKLFLYQRVKMTSNLTAIVKDAKFFLYPPLKIL